MSGIYETPDGQKVHGDGRPVGSPQESDMTPTKIKLPEKLEAYGNKSSYVAFDGGEIQVHCDDISHSDGCKIAREIARRWNAFGELKAQLLSAKEYLQITAKCTCSPSPKARWCYKCTTERDISKLLSRLEKEEGS